MDFKNSLRLSLISSALFAAGCGGGGGGSSSPAPTVEDNPVPVVSISDVTVDEKSSVSITAAVDTKTDSVASYEWSVSSDFDIELTGQDTGSLSFTAPEVSEDSTVDISLTVTDSSGDATTANAVVSVSQLTIPVTISGLATDSPIANAQITVNIGGNDVTVEVTADENGAYTVDLVLDDSEADAFISIVARGQGDQDSAALISMLGSASQLQEQAGEDGVLTAEESFAVNVTNVTTAQYALAKIANGGEEITSDEQLEEISESLDYDAVMMLATAIKVAIDKATENTELALPTEIPDTLTLVEAIVDAVIGEESEEADAANEYVQEVQDEPEFEEAQEEILEDENLVDTNGFVMPSTYFLLPPTTLQTGVVFYFNEDNTGASIDAEFIWEESAGFISMVNTSYEKNASVEWIDLPNDQIEGDVQVEVESWISSYQARRVSSNDLGDVVSLTTTRVKRYIQTDLDDEVTSTTETHFALRDSDVKPITIESSAVGYLTTGFQDEINGALVSADEFTFNADGTGSSLLHDQDFDWEINEGVLELSYANEGGDVTFKLLSEQSGVDFFANEAVVEDGVEALSLSEGKLASEYPEWDIEDIPGIYDYESFTFDEPTEQFWFELFENGDAITYRTSDGNNDGKLEYSEVSTMYGTWYLNEDNELVITRVREQALDHNGEQVFGGYNEACKLAETEGCMLFHERTWRLLDVTEASIGLFHEHYFHYSTSPSWNLDDYISYDVRRLLKVDEAPIDVEEIMEAQPSRAQTSKVKTSVEVEKISNKFSKLEPQ